MSQLDRRSFLLALAASLAAGPAVATGAIKGSGDDWKAAFDRALKKKPWLLGFKSVSRPVLETKKLTIEGRIPDGLRGVFYRNGAARHEIGDFRYRHWFDGDGMVQAFRIGDNGISHIGRMVATDKYTSEIRAGRPLERTFGTVLPGTRPTRSAEQVNTANINIIRHGGELLALWEGGSAYRLDSTTLKTIGKKTWSKDTKGLPFGAHPRLDTDGTLWNIGYSAYSNALLIYRIDAAGKLKDRSLIQLKNVPMVHDFMITARHLILILPPFYIAKNRKGAFIDHFEWHPEMGGRALIFDKNDLSRFKQVDIPSFWVFHFDNAWEDKSGIIRFGAPIYENTSAMTETFRYIMRGELRASPVSRYITATLDPQRGKFAMTPVTSLAATEFPRIDPRRIGKRNRYTITMQQSNGRIYGGFDTVVRMNNETGSLSRFAYPSYETAEEHIYVANPKSNTENAGWVLGTALNTKTGTTSLNIFDAARLADGPIAKARLPYPIPLGLHGNFVTA